jgi:putative aminopeptidase FrvX
MTSSRSVDVYCDEVGFEVTNIAGDGTVSLRTRGGLFSSLWEGQPALLHVEIGKLPVNGIFVPRDAAHGKATRSADGMVWHGR